MRDAIEEYLDQVMAHASLARRDQARVRAELKDHLAELAAIEHSAQRKDNGANGLERSHLFRSELEAQYDGSQGSPRKWIANDARRVDCDPVE